MSSGDDFDLSSLMKKNLNTDSAVIFGDDSDDDCDGFDDVDDAIEVKEIGASYIIPPTTSSPQYIDSNYREGAAVMYGGLPVTVGTGEPTSPKPNPNPKPNPSSNTQTTEQRNTSLTRKDAQGNKHMKLESEGEKNSVRLTREMQNLFGDVKSGMLPFGAIPPGMVEYFLARIKRWERIEARNVDSAVNTTPIGITASSSSSTSSSPSSPISSSFSSPPTDVLQAFLKYTPTGYKFPKKKRGVGLQNHDKLFIRVVLEPKSYKLELVFNMANTDIGRVAYQKKMQEWSPIDWAWFIAIFFKKLDKVAGHVSLSYKLMTRPDKDPKKKFAHEIELAFYDIQAHYFAGNEAILQDSEDILIGFGVPGDESDILADISWAFDDEKTLPWVRALGFNIEDRCDHAARCYYGAGSTDIVVIDHTGKRYTGHKNYLESRLSDCCDSTIDKAESDMRKAFIFDHVLSQQIPYTRWLPTNELNDQVLWDRYNTFKRKALATSRLLLDSTKVGGISGSGSGNTNSSSSGLRQVTDASGEGSNPNSFSVPVVSGIAGVPSIVVNPLLLSPKTLPTITAMQAVSAATTTPTGSKDAICCVVCKCVEGERNSVGAVVDKLMLCTCKMLAFRYCSRECQKADWKNHKIVCKMHTHKLLVSRSQGGV